MDIEIKKLSPERLEDYIYYFDHVAFSDHSDWSWCYCTEPHCDAEMDERLNDAKECRRNFAIDLINQGVMQGYLAYAEGKVVGWCSAGDKKGYKRLRADQALWSEADGDIKIKSIVCFSVAPAMRGNGIATQLLDRVCLDAGEEGFACVEAYPYKFGKDCFEEYHGPVALYEKKGFVVHKDLEKVSVVRKCL